MPIYRLKPVNPADPRWNCSRWSGEAIVRAASETDARHCAAREFLRPGIEIVSAENPWWRSAEAAQCLEVLDPRYNLIGPEEVLEPKEASLAHGLQPRAAPDIHDQNRH